MDDSFELEDDGGSEVDVEESATPQNELDDLGFIEDDATPARKRRKDYEVEYRVLPAADVARMLTHELQQVSGLLGIPEADAFALLALYRWKQDRLLEAYYENENGVLVKAGVLPAERGAPATTVGPVSGFECKICFDDSTNNEVVTLLCGHRACTSCYGQYVNSKLTNEADCRLRCIARKCNLALPETLILQFANASAKQRYGVGTPNGRAGRMPGRIARRMSGRKGARMT